MARTLYGATPADFGVTDPGDGSVDFAAITLDVYKARNGDPMVDLLDKDGLAVSQVTASAGETIEFQGEDGFYDDAWVTPDSGTTWYRIAPSINPLVDRVETLEGAGGGGGGASDLDGLDDVNTSGVADDDVLGYNSTTQTWTPRAVATPANTLQGVIITDGSSSDAYPDDDFLVFRPVA